eukprot:272337-Hanusia_phi.AAC.1
MAEAQEAAPIISQATMSDGRQTVASETEQLDISDQQAPPDEERQTGQRRPRGRPPGSKDKFPRLAKWKRFEKLVESELRGHGVAHAKKISQLIRSHAQKTRINAKHPKTSKLSGVMSVIPV